MSKRTYQNYTILSAAVATGAGTGINIQDYRHLILWFATASSANLTVKVQASISVNEPDWDSAQSVTNEWDYIDILPAMTKTDTIYYGDDGISVAGTDDYKLLQVNTDGLKWLNVIVTARSAGSVTVKLKAFND